jgi:low temperature requirement protein LtrA
MWEPLVMQRRSKVMGGRDPHEQGRASTPLELLFDLTFVIAFGIAGAQFAHGVSEAHWGAALTGFGFAMFAICWAWINFSWFASAYDTDDWIFRLATMVQMVGVIVLALGLPAMFASIEHGGHIDNSIMVLGYVIMRLALVFQWLRAARQDPLRRSTALTYAVSILVAQAGWIALLIADTSAAVFFICAAVLVFIELLGPIRAEGKTEGTPWHAHHIAERYGLLAIIALGEGVVGTVASVSAFVEESGWSLDSITLCLAGTGLTFAMWWIYFLLPSAPILHKYRNRGYVWGYGHVILYGAIAATGAGLHVVGNLIAGEAKIGGTQAVASVAVAVGLYILSVFLLHWHLVRRQRVIHLAVMLAGFAVLALAVLIASAGYSITLSLLTIMMSPVLVVLGFEILGKEKAEKDVKLAISHG